MFGDIYNYVDYISGLNLNIFARTHSKYMTELLKKIVPIVP